MKTAFVVIGKTDASWLVDAIADYSRRLVHYLPFEMIVLPDARSVKNRTEAQQKEMEGEQLLKAFQTSDHVILLDEHGKQFSSVEFATFIAGKMQTVPKRLVFVIGGPYGFSDAVRQRANGKISLSRMTFSHQMVRVIFLEQLYRALTILNNEPYHHE